MNLKLFILILIQSTYLANAAELRIKDITSIKGVRENPLVGYGLVIGLNGTGDESDYITNQSLKKMLRRIGLHPKNEINSKNIASVIVSAKLPPFPRSGQKIDVTLSSIGNAASLAGGSLLLTPLKGPDGKIYAIASGPLSIGGLEQGKIFPTTARIPNGATIEKDIDIDFNKKSSIRISLNNPDFTTAYRIEKTLNDELGGLFSSAKDASTIDLIIPDHYKKNTVKLIATIENLKISPDTKSKIVINERTGTIIYGGEILLDSFSLSHKNISIEIKDENNQEGPAQKKKFFYIKGSSSVNDLVNALSKLGVNSEDLISIFQNLKANGLISSQLEFI